jgi:hypothetical protein
MGNDSLNSIDKILMMEGDDKIDSPSKNSMNDLDEGIVDDHVSAFAAGLTGGIEMIELPDSKSRNTVS